MTALYSFPVFGVAPKKISAGILTMREEMEVHDETRKELARNPNQIYAGEALERVVSGVVPDESEHNYIMQEVMEASARPNGMVILGIVIDEADSVQVAQDMDNWTESAADTLQEASEEEQFASSVTYETTYKFLDPNYDII